MESSWLVMTMHGSIETFHGLHTLMDSWHYAFRYCTNDKSTCGKGGYNFSKTSFIRERLYNLLGHLESTRRRSLGSQTFTRGNRKVWGCPYTVAVAVQRTECNYFDVIKHSFAHALIMLLTQCASSTTNATMLEQ